MLCQIRIAKLFQDSRHYASRRWQRSPAELPRAEQKVQAEGAQRLNGMSGHELPKQCGMSGLANVVGHFARCR